MSLVHHWHLWKSLIVWACNLRHLHPHPRTASSRQQARVHLCRVSVLWSMQPQVILPSDAFHGGRQSLELGWRRREGDHTSDDLEEGGESQSQIPEVNEEVELDADEAKTKKRRLDADEVEDERAGEREGAGSDDADHGKGVEVSGEKDDGVEGSVEEESVEEPPRKKAKNHAA